MKSTMNDFKMSFLDPLGFWECCYFNLLYLYTAGKWALLQVVHQDRLAHIRFFGLMHSEKEGFSEKTSIVKHSTVKSLLVKLASKYSYSF